MYLVWRAADRRAEPVQVTRQVLTLMCRRTGKLGNYKVARNSHQKGSPYSITERRVLELIPVLGSQPAGDVSYEPGGRLPLLSARPAVTRATLKTAATSFAAW